MPATSGAALFTLSVLTGVVMLAAGLLKLGSILRFVSNAVMVGFINAVGVNIILGQLANFTGYDAAGRQPDRPRRQHPRQARASSDLPTLAVGVATIALIILLERTRLGVARDSSSPSLPPRPWRPLSGGGWPR